MTPSDFTASAQDRSRFFWWLAEWFLSPPTPEQLATLPSLENAELSDSPADALEGAWHTLAVAGSHPESESLNVLGVEYTRLFSGVQEGLGPPPPFESVWREDRLVGEYTVQVIDAYAKAGFVDIALEAGPQDHVAVELRFIALLSLREAEAWQAGDMAVAHQRLIQQRDFLKQHLAVWAPRWADAVIQQAHLPLYAALAGLLKAGLDQAALELAELACETN